MERGTRTAQTLEAALGRLLIMLRPDAKALGCIQEIEHSSEIAKRGSSASAQVHVYAEARLSGLSKTRALKKVVAWLMRTTTQLQEGVAA